MDFLCLEFVNSSWYITHKSFTDPLMDNGWLKALADKWNMELLPAPNEEELTSLIDMRDKLSGLFEKLIVGNKLSEADIELINSYMISVSSHRELHKKDGLLKLYEIPELRSWSWFMAEVAASFSRLCSSEAVDSLKMCQNPECKWLFIDESKSRNRKWCDDTCATLMKVRRFRQKGKENKNI